MEIREEKARLRGLLADLTSKEYVQKHTKLCSAMRELYEDIESDFYTIVVVGEFKRGKSTLVNALLGTKLLPMDVLPETATINAISYQEEPQLTVLLRDGTAKQGEVSYDFLKQYSARQENAETDSVRYIKIGYPCELLNNRIVLVDTPGVSDLSAQRAEITYQFLPKANAVLFVLDANSPLKKTEKEFIDDRLLPLGIHNILFLLNKYDTVDEDEDPDFLVNVQRRLLKAFQMDEKEAALKDISLLPLSAKQALQAIEKKNDTLLAASGLPTVRKKLEEMLFSGLVEKDKLDRYKKRFSRLLASLSREIESDKALKSANAAELEKAAETLQALLYEQTANREAMDQYADEFKTQLYAMTDKSLRFFGENLKRDVMEAIEQHHSQNFKTFIEHDVAKCIERQVNTWIGTYAPHIDEFIHTLERELGLGLARHFHQRIKLQASKGERLRGLDVMLNLEAEDLSDVGTKTGAITAIGAIGISMFLSPILIPILSFWGRNQIFENILNDRLETAKNAIIPQVEEQLVQALAALSSHIHSYIDKRVIAVKQNTNCAYETILQDFQKRIRREIEEKKTKESALHSQMEALDSQQQEIQSVLGQII